jgi:hypothetical protein
MNQKQITIDCIWEDDESFFIIPSGFKDRYIVVNESPVDLEVKHVNKKEIDLLKENE